MTMPKSKGRAFKVNGKDYVVTVSGGDVDEGDNVELHVCIQAHYGHRSYCQIRGLTSRLRFHDYREVEAMQRNSISITPSMICELVALAHLRGWKPDESKSTFEFLATKATVDEFRKTGRDQMDSCESLEP
jgi:hypothetical protein